MCICWIYYIHLNITESSLEVNFQFLCCLKYQFAFGSNGHSTTTVFTFMCPCIASIIINDDQQGATIFYLLISSLLYMFRATLSPIIRST
jgi:hypothetical protein